MFAPNYIPIRTPSNRTEQLLHWHGSWIVTFFPNRNSFGDFGGNKILRAELFFSDSLWFCGAGPAVWAAKTFWGRFHQGSTNLPPRFLVCLLFWNRCVLDCQKVLWKAPPRLYQGWVSLTFWGKSSWAVHMFRGRFLQGSSKGAQRFFKFRGVSGSLEKACFPLPKSLVLTWFVDIWLKATSLSSFHQGCASLIGLIGFRVPNSSVRLWQAGVGEPRWQATGEGPDQLEGLREGCSSERNERLILAAKHYVCERCYERQKLGQAPPASRQIFISLQAPASRFVALRLLKCKVLRQFWKNLMEHVPFTLDCRKLSELIQQKDGAQRQLKNIRQSVGTCSLDSRDTQLAGSSGRKAPRVTRTAFEMEDIKQANNKGLEEVCIHVPSRINQRSWTRGFSLHTSGGLVTHRNTMSLTSELWNFRFAPDVAISFNRTQGKRLKAACAMMRSWTRSTWRRRTATVLLLETSNDTTFEKNNKWRGPAVRAACEAVEASDKTCSVVSPLRNVPPNMSYLRFHMQGLQ